MIQVVTKEMIQVATKERIPIKEEGEEPLEIHNISRIYQKSEKKQKPSKDFFNELIKQAKFIQDILIALGVMLEEI